MGIKIRQHYRIALLCTLLAGCNNSLQQKLIDAKYWDYYDLSTKSLEGGYEFNKDGSCFYYIYVIRGKKPIAYRTRAHYSPDDVVDPSTWHMTGDSLLRLQYIDTKITSLKNDTLVLKKAKGNGNIILINHKVNKMAKGD